MDERWWPGLREHLRTVEEDERLDERDRALGFRVFLAGRTRAPGNVSGVTAITVALLAVVILGVVDYGGERGISIVVLAVFVALRVVEWWYGRGARLLRAHDAVREGRDA
jgi:hypothetical protein